MDNFMSQASAYGAGMVGGEFNLAVFLKKPSVLLKIICALFGLFVWMGVGGAWVRLHGADMCLFGQSSGTCSWGVFIGVMAFFGGAALICLEFGFEKISSVNNRRKAVIADLAICGIFAFLWFITFFVLVTKWAQDLPADIIDGSYSSFGPKAGIAFAFLSIGTWGGCVFFAWKRFQEGAASAFAPSYDEDFSAVPPYGYDPQGGVTTESYQEPPFSATNQAAPPMGGGYQQPTY